jgi:hypothetical protein
MDRFNSGNYQHLGVDGANTRTFMPNDGFGGQAVVDPSSSNKFSVGPPGGFERLFIAWQFISTSCMLDSTLVIEEPIPG